MKGRVVPLLLLAELTAVCLAREPSFEEFRAIHDSLLMQPPRLRARWLDERGLEMPGWNAPLPSSDLPDSGGLRLVGKWGRGPSYEVTGKGSLVALTLGSEVALIDFANPDSPVVLTEIQLDLTPRQSALYDSFLVTTNRAIEFWNIADPRAPVKRGSIPYTVGDFAIADTFLFFVCGDTFHAYTIADPVQPRRLGRCLEGGYVMAATRNVAVVRAPGDAVDFIDVSDPTVPRKAGTYPVFALGAAARGSICCVNMCWNTDGDHCRFDVVDITDPTTPRRIGVVDSVGGYDVHMDCPFAFISGFYLDEWEFCIVDIQNPANPRLVSACMTPGYNFGVWAESNSERAFVADAWGGLSVIDIANPAAPELVAVTMKADRAVDTWVDGDHLYVADYSAGLRVVDISDPARPRELGGYDSAQATRFACEAVAALDSFVFIGWWPRPTFRTVLVSDPTNPREVAGFSVPSRPEDMVLRDTLVFGVGRMRFYVVNVAQPRESVLVGSCNTVLDGTEFGLALKDTFAYIGSDLTQVVDVARPDSPRVVTTIGRASPDLSIADSILFCTPGPAIWYSLANPAAPVPIDSIDMGHWITAMTAVGRTIYACSGPSYTTLYAISIEDLHQPRIIAQSTLPYCARRIVYAEPYLYIACWDAGVCIYDTAHVAIAEVASDAQKRPGATLVWGMLGLPGETDAELLDICGRRVMELRPGPNDVRHVVPGVYFVRSAVSGRRNAVTKVVITQ